MKFKDAKKVRVGDMVWAYLKKEDSRPQQATVMAIGSINVGLSIVASERLVFLVMHETGMGYIDHLDLGNKNTWGSLTPENCTKVLTPTE